MDILSFTRKMHHALPPGTVMNNPAGGTTTVEWIDNERLCYRRGRALFYVSLQELHSAYLHFRGGQTTTTALREFAPEVFDSSAKGHNCNCTVLFMALERMGLAGPISGRGRRGDPFAVRVTHGS
ncbi:MAG: hypothetical protein Q8P50_04115 [Bacillota bacterium]|nr:hypothetical protein [Bacillota bacterium]